MPQHQQITIEEIKAKITPFIVKKEIQDNSCIRMILLDSHKAPINSRAFHDNKEFIDKKLFFENFHEIFNVNKSDFKQDKEWFYFKSESICFKIIKTLKPFSEKKYDRVYICGGFGYEQGSMLFERKYLMIKA